MKLIEIFPDNWKTYLGISDDYFDSLDSKIAGQQINPKFEHIFNAFNIPPNDIKVVIVGQDPYPDSNDAMGLAFSIPNQNKKIPASLRNIKKELNSDLGVSSSSSGDLTPWREQGILLLNRILTTNTGESLSHANFGWEDFTDLVIDKLCKEPIIFILWGKLAQQLGQNIDDDKKITGVHPSPLSAHRGFFGSKPFSQANEKLKKLGKLPIDWKI
ncbi:MAG: hypothetical protein RL129_9 [Actinomycetota bacterium]|jgi:uracil-DNA glycosylase